MKLSIFLHATFLFVVLFSVPMQAGAKKIHKKKLTLLIYGAVDNNLEPYMAFHQSQVEREGLAEDIRVLYFICKREENGTKVTIKAKAQGNKTVMIKEMAGMDSGHKDTLLEALRWASTFESQHRGILFCAHGFGFNAASKFRIAYDSTTGNALCDRDIRECFAQAIKENFHKPIDFVGFDTCSTAAFEMAYALAPYARYMIASEATIAMGGWPYNLLIRAFKEGKKEPLSFVRSIVTSYKLYYAPLTQEYTLSLIDLHHIEPLAENLKEMTQVLTELLQSKNSSFYKMFKTALTQTVRFGSLAHVDLLDWYECLNGKLAMPELSENPETAPLIKKLKRSVHKGIVAINRAVTLAVHGSRYPRAHGMFIYLPLKRPDPRYADCYWAQQTDWIHFIERYNV